MKKPEKHTPNDNWKDEMRCVRDGEVWPCQKYKKWLKTDKHNISVLEQRVHDLEGASTSVQTQFVKSLARIEHQKKLIDAMLMWLGDLGAGNRITVEVHRDIVDVTSINDEWRRFTYTGPAEVNVTYKSAGGKTYVNGKPV